MEYRYCVHQRAGNEGQLFWFGSLWHPTPTSQNPDIGLSHSCNNFGWSQELTARHIGNGWFCDGNQTCWKMVSGWCRNQWHFLVVSLINYALLLSLACGNLVRRCIVNAPSNCFNLMPQDFIVVKGKHATFVAHTAGRYQRKRFRKVQVLFDNGVQHNFDGNSPQIVPVDAALLECCISKWSTTDSFVPNIFWSLCSARSLSDLHAL